MISAAKLRKWKKAGKPVARYPAYKDVALPKGDYERQKRAYIAYHMKVSDCIPLPVCGWDGTLKEEKGGKKHAAA